MQTFSYFSWSASQPWYYDEEQCIPFMLFFLAVSIEFRKKSILYQRSKNLNWWTSRLSIAVQIVISIQRDAKDFFYSIFLASALPYLAIFLFKILIHSSLIAAFCICSLCIICLFCSSFIFLSLPHLFIYSTRMTYVKWLLIF